MASLMRVAFLGLPLAALLIAADGHEVCLAGMRKGLTSGLRRLTRTIGRDRIVIDPHRDWSCFAARCRLIEPDLLVSWFFTRQIPMPVCRACRLGGIGVHPSLLPRHRGPDPYFAAIDAGDTHSGVTVHQLEQTYDTGAILSQVQMPISPRWNAWQLARALDRPSLALLRSTVAALSHGESLAVTCQDESLATQAPRPSEDDRVLRWHQPAAAIVRRVRALAPNPGAIIQVGDEQALLLEAVVDDRVPRALQTGEAGVVGDMAIVKASDAGVGLMHVELEHGSLRGPQVVDWVIAAAQSRGVQYPDR